MFRRATTGIAAALAGGAAVFAAPAKSCVCILAPPPGASAEGPKGTVTFTQREGDARVTVRVRASGVAPGKHGFHIHALGDLTQGCISAGGHFNPLKMSFHGGPGDFMRHAGDMGNVEASAEGIVDATIVDDKISLDAASDLSIVGRSCVLHADEDDLGRGFFEDSSTTGHAGARIACGVIGLAADVEVA